MSKEVKKFFDDAEDFSDYELWSQDMGKLHSLIFNHGKELGFDEIYLYGEYAHVKTYKFENKVVRIATKSADKSKLLTKWDELEEILKDYPVVFTDYDYLISGQADTGAKPDDLTMFKFSRTLLYSNVNSSWNDLDFLSFQRDLTEDEMRRIVDY